MSLIALLGINTSIASINVLTFVLIPSHRFPLTSKLLCWNYTLAHWAGQWHLPYTFRYGSASVDDAYRHQTLLLKRINGTSCETLITDSCFQLVLHLFIILVPLWYQPLLMLYTLRRDNQLKVLIVLFSHSVSTSKDTCVWSIFIFVSTQYLLISVSTTTTSPNGFSPFFEHVGACCYEVMFWRAGTVRTPSSKSLSAVPCALCCFT